MKTFQRVIGLCGVNFLRGYSTYILYVNSIKRFQEGCTVDEDISVPWNAAGNRGLLRNKESN